MYLENNAQVWGIVGNLGGGKTLTAVEVACSAMKVGYFVVTNIQLNMDRVCRDFGAHCSRLYQLVDLESASPDSWPSGSPRGSHGGKRVMVILDEVAEWFDQFSSTSPAVKRFLSWLRHSSKRSQDVFLVVQRREYLAKSLRILVSRWIWVDDLATFRVPKLRIHIPFCAHLCYRSYFDRVGNSVQPGSSIVKAKWGRYYSTAQCLSVSLAGPHEYASPERAFSRPLDPDWLYVAFLVLAYFLL